MREASAAMPRARSSVDGSRFRRSHLHGHDPPLACVTFIFVFFPTDFRAKVETARGLSSKKEVCLPCNIREQ